MVKHLCIVFLGVCALLPANAREFSFDLRASTHTTLQSVAPGAASRCVRRTATARTSTAAARDLAVGDRLSLRLFNDVALTLTLVAREESPLVANAFQAELEGDDGLRTAVVIETENGLLVNVQNLRSGLVYTVVPTEDGTAVRELDPTAESTTDAARRTPSVSLPETPDGTEDPLLAPQSVNQSSTVVDILVAYDSTAAAWTRLNGGGITNFAQQAVSKMNVALANNRLDELFRFRLVGVVAVAVNGNGDLEGVLDDVTAGSGAWAAVTALRDAIGADIVCTMIDTGSASGTTGLGWSLVQTSPRGIAAFADNAFNVTAVRAVAQGHTMTHEAGHNMGTGHSDMQTSDPGPQSYAYSRGFYFTGTDSVAYHTIMSYNSDGQGGSYRLAPLFSDPDATWSGVAAGDATHDNARVLEQNYARVTQFRSQRIPLNYDVFFSPESGTLFSDSLTVTLTPGRSGLIVRYTLDGTTPTALHGTVYTGPIAITTTTTIKAVTVDDGTPGPVYEAVYHVSDLGAALNAPQLTWSTSPTYPWTAQATDTHDGVLAVKSADPFPVEGRNYYGENSWLKTSVTGPTKMSFRYKETAYTPGFEVSVDGARAFATTASNPDDWLLAEVDVPAGQHEVKFSWTLRGSYWQGFNGVVLDQVLFDALSRPPTVLPATTADEATATTFRDSLTVTLAPGVADGIVRYTLDGSDPAGDGGIVYTGPFRITRSTLVRAVEADLGKEASAEVRALYLERHPLGPGEWTSDVAGVRAASTTNGSLVCVLLANHGTCGYSRAFYPVAMTQTFLNWAKTNGVYLVVSDESLFVDAAAAESWFWRLYSSFGDGTSASYPTMYFARPAAPDVAVAKGLARRNGGTIGSVAYAGTVDSLVAGVASVLSSIGVTPGALPPAAPDEVLGTSGIVWSNGSSTPWREEYPGRMRAGGLMRSSHTSVLTAQVSGRGRLVFSYRAVSYSSRNKAEFALNGVRQFSCAYNGATTFAGTVTNDVSSVSGATFTWTCTVGDLSRDYGDEYSEPCGFWISDVRWIPEGVMPVERLDGQGNVVEVPAEWLVANGLATFGATAEELAAAADGDPDGDGMPSWQEYVCGTDPRDGAKVLQCIISLDDGAVVVGYEPSNGYLPGYAPIVRGKTSLDEATWSSRSAAHRFFKVFVEKTVP